MLPFLWFSFGLGPRIGQTSSKHFSGEEPVIARSNLAMTSPNKSRRDNGLIVRLSACANFSSPHRRATEETVSNVICWASRIKLSAFPATRSGRRRSGAKSPGLCVYLSRHSENPELEPDLVLAFSDLQADIVSDLVRAGVAIHVFNQRDIAGILAMIHAGLTRRCGRARRSARHRR